MPALTRCLAIAVATLLLSAPALADNFTISYKTYSDAPGYVPILFKAKVVATADPFTGPGGFGIPQAYLPTSIIGDRGGVAFANGDPDLFFFNFSEFYFPATTAAGFGGSPTYLDGGFATLTYQINGVDYSLSRNNSTFYLELSGGGGEQILASDFSITRDAPAAVPEPASWAMMLAGFAAAGVTLRRRRPVAALA